VKSPSNAFPTMSMGGTILPSGLWFQLPQIQATQASGETLSFPSSTISLEGGLKLFLSSGLRITKSNSAMIPSKSLILCLLTAAPGICQTAPKRDEEKPVPQLCVVTVGAPAGNIADWKSDSVFSFKPTDPGATPPMDLHYPLKENGKTSYKLLPFGLGQCTPPVVALQSPFVLYKRSQGEGESENFTPDLKLPVKDSLLTAVVLWRDKKNPDWEKPNILSVDASPEAWPQGEARFLNLSPTLMGLTLPEGRIVIKPASSHAIQVMAGKPFPYQIEAEVQGKAFFVCRTTVSMTSPKRSLVVIFGNQKGELESMSIDIPMPIPPAVKRSVAAASEPTPEGDTN